MKGRRHPRAEMLNDAASDREGFECGALFSSPARKPVKRVRARRQSAIGHGRGFNVRDPIALEQGILEMPHAGGRRAF